ncbi:MAG: glycosyltransferase [Segetibacter sp.]|nr:glycosyltransferase [Segetibacter sp.]
MFFVKDILAVVVIYKIKIADCATLISLNASASSINEKLDVIVYDNSPGFTQTTSISYDNLNCYFIEDESNPGVSKAYNYAGVEGFKRGKKFLLLLDQDTYFPSNAISAYMEAVNAHCTQKLFCPILQTSKGIYSPLKYYFRRGTNWNDVKPGTYSLKNVSVLNSGILVDAGAFKSTGGYNERIKLYFSDFDFINRFRRKYKYVVIVDLYCRHSLSDLDVQDYDSAIKRFNYYVQGSYNSILSFKDYLYLFVTIFLRSIKLSYRYKRMTFVNTFFKKYLLARFFKIPLLLL